MKHITKADIVERIALGTGITKLETEAIVEGFITSIIEALKSGKSIEIRGFGSYSIRKKRGRMARNPKSGDKVFINEHFAPAFKFSREFKAIVADGMKDNL
jgi:DNA-binding protein HU-beta